MDEKIDVRKALRVFQQIMSDGERIDNQYHLNGLVAHTDFDGYTATIRNDYVCLDIFFHNKFSFTYSDNKEKMLFLEKMNTLDAA